METFLLLLLLYHLPLIGVVAVAARSLPRLLCIPLADSFLFFLFLFYPFLFLVESSTCFPLMHDGDTPREKVNARDIAAIFSFSLSKGIGGGAVVLLFFLLLGEKNHFFFSSHFPSDATHGREKWRVTTSFFIFAKVAVIVYTQHCIVIVACCRDTRAGERIFFLNPHTRDYEEKIMSWEKEEEEWRFWISLTSKEMCWIEFVWNCQFLFSNLCLFLFNFLFNRKTQRKGDAVRWVVGCSDGWIMRPIIGRVSVSASYSSLSISFWLPKEFIGIDTLADGSSRQEPLVRQHNLNSFFFFFTCSTFHPLVGM